MTTTSKSLTPRSIRKALAKVEDAARHKAQQETRGAVVDIGQPLTIARLRQPPLAQLIEARKIGPDEQAAADEIVAAYEAIARRVMIKPPSLAKVDGSRPQPDLEALIHDGRYAEALPWPARTAAMVGRYQAFAAHWSERAQRGDPTLAILISAVIDETPIRGVNGIAFNEGVGYSRVERAIIAGLRDYAARAGMVTGGQAARWQREAAEIFHVKHPELGFAENSSTECRGHNLTAGLDLVGCCPKYTIAPAKPLI